MSAVDAADWDGAVDRDLVRGLRRAEFRRRLAAFLLVLPLLAFVAVNFVVPVAWILVMSVDDRDVSSTLSRTIAALAEYPDAEVPPEPVFQALFYDIAEGREDFTLVSAAKRLNSAKSGFNALLSRTGRELEAIEPPAGGYRDAFLEADRRWGDTEWWSAIRLTSRPVTPVYLLSAFDLTLTGDGEVTRVAPTHRIFLDAWARTLWIALVVTTLCAVLGYPLAYFMASSPPGIRNIVLILVLIPFWTSLLVRTIAWLVLLQSQGVINDLGLGLGLWTERLQLIYNRPGVYITMTHVLLPFMVLPLYASMTRVPRSHVRAALSLGAHPIDAFRHVYFPMTKHGLGAGALLVFTLAIGFYVTPALVGGPTDQLISYYIAFYTNTVLNWGAAAALSVFLLALTAAVFYAVRVAFGMNRAKIQ